MTTVRQSLDALDTHLSALKEQAGEAVRVAVAAERRKTRIRYQLLMARVSAAAIGRRSGVSRGMVCHVIAGRKRNPRVEAALARVHRKSAR